MKTITNTITITTERGTVVDMTVTALRGYEIVKEVSFCDGHNVEIEKGKEVDETTIVLVINGKDYEGYFTTNMTANELKGCYGVFLAGSQPVGLSQVKYNELTDVVNATKKEAETDETWIDYKIKEAENIKMNQYYDAHVAEVEKMMSM